MKKFIAMLLVCVFAFSINTYGFSDEYILNDPVENTFLGRQEAVDIIENLKFKDVAAGHWAQEVITRSGALDLVKGYNSTFSPNATVSKQEAIAYVLRAIDYEKLAVARGMTFAATYPDASTLQLWSYGYLNYAMTLGLITNAQYQDALVENQEELQEDSFKKNSPATREEVADWLYLALKSVDATRYDPAAKPQKVLTFNDWQSITPTKVAGVEAIAIDGIMGKDAKGNFRPKSSVTKAEMAQILSNIDSVYFKLVAIQKKAGTIALIRDNQETSTTSANLVRNVYIRTQDGKVDILQYEQPRNTSPQVGIKDVVVYKNKAVSGLSALEEGDQIEYLVKAAADPKVALYVNVVSSVVLSEVEGKLSAVNTVGGKTLTIQGSGDKKYTYKVIDSALKNMSGETVLPEYNLLMDDKLYPLSTLPYGGVVKLKLKNDTVIEIKYIGHPVITPETRGIVVENFPELGYLTIIDNNGNRITKSYYENNLVVEKQQYYDLDDEIGYLNQMFPNFEYDPRSTIISDIEPGDVVFIRTAKDDDSRIESISASTNYIMRYGKVKQINNQQGYSTVLVEYENKQTSWFDIADGIFITKDGKLIRNIDVLVGDWAKFLVNEAIIEPGYVIESVKEMTVEGDEHFISSIVKGELAGINSIQKQLIIEGAQNLSKTGWVDYKDLTQLSIASKDVLYYYGDKQISLDYAVKYFKNSSAQVYVAMENNYTGERVKKVTFRLDRDEILSPDTVLDSNGNAFSILSHVGDIATDSGTIVRRHGRLVDGTDVMPSDYLRVVLNGDKKAAIIDIVETPDVSQIMISRARVATIKDNVSFKAQSVSMLSGTTWIYTPVQREFAIDTKTMFLNEDGYVDPKTFVTYTSDSAVDKVYNIVGDGSRAAFVIDSPYSNKAARGTIYKIDGDTIWLKDSYTLDDTVNKWKPVSITNSSLGVTLQKNTIIAKNNEIVLPAKLEVGDQIRIMTNTIPSNVTSGTVIIGYIVIVEK